MAKACKIFNQLYHEAQEDSDIIGFFLGGSHGRNMANEFSDYDVYIIVKDFALQKYKRRYSKIKNKDVDIILFSLTGFKRYALHGSSEQWAGYSFAHIKVIIDKNKQIQRLVDQKSKAPKKEVKAFITGNLDGYINYVYRSIKCLRNGDELAARLEAAYSLPLFLDVAFALHNCRLRPYYKYLRWELENYPLIKLPVNAQNLLEKISRILDTADINEQQQLLMMCETVFRKAGYGRVFDSWGEKLQWMKTFRRQHRLYNEKKTL